jgi:hypothetical protein
MSDAPKCMNQRIREAKSSKQGGTSVTVAASKQSDTSRKLGQWMRGEPVEETKPALSNDDESLRFDERGRLIEE